ncbi:hypothetical protein SDRG_03018 [Saprolegnia diclina VS20]|uniref:Importin N-terminal domain-containing protein n=1 Tax=Saprolegnia diclina (strain VS20) TaxID=1156394 RepID=T0QNC7_SAPDV|nr:hypothetical protein SDRG_03018 [Saprolegnia diclina VS20]EQC39584.1 hypothetical protein SDRG_03018 [Saprolegnia diclina VS20]|eukprot:XP_008606856.1 hypothetical protein SDRG_03018 [Saprolegnia diclina VS20]
MDSATLHNILLHTFSEDAGARSAAEAAISGLHSVRGSVVLLVELATRPDVQREIQQAAAILLKNLIQGHWGHDSDCHPVEPEAVFPDADKDEYRKFILQGLFDSHVNSIQNLMVESVNIIARQDFPERWPTLIEDIRATLQCGDPHRICNALLALRKVVKIYEYKPPTQRETLNVIVVATFPLLRTMLQQLLSNPSIEAGHMVHLICKIFWSCVQCTLPPYLTTEEMTGWMELLKTLMSKPMPELPGPTSPDDEETRHRHPWWKAKKWGIQIISRFYTSWGNPKHATASQEMATFFRSTIAPHLLVSVLETLALRPQGHFCPDRVVQLCLVYLQEAIISGASYQQLLPHLDFVLFKVLHPVMCLTPSDLAVYEADPQEYVRRTNDVMGEYLHPVYAAETLLSDLCTKRGKHCVSKVLGFYNHILVTPANDDDGWIQKEAALHALGALDAFLTLSPAHQSQMESIVLAHVLPAFQSPRGYMRLRATKMVSRNYMTKLVFQDSTMTQLVSCVLATLQDPDLPVRIEAAKSFRHLVMYNHTTIVLDVLRPVLPTVLEQFFKIMDDMGFSDEVILALEQLIDQFCDEMGPYAVQLVLRLSQRFKQCLDAEDDEDDACLTAASCLDTINTVLMSIYNHPELFEPLLDALIPILHLLLSSDSYIDFVEPALDIVKSITFYSKSIHPKVWLLFPSLFRGADAWGSEYMHSFVAVLFSVIGRDANGFLQGVLQVNLPTGVKRISYLELVFNFVRKLLHKPEVDEEDVWGACQTMDCILFNCDGIDMFVPPCLQLVCMRLSRTPQHDTRVVTSLLGVVLSALHYSVPLTLSVLDKMTVVDPVLNSLLRNADVRTRYSEQKVFVLGMVSLLRVPQAELPAVVQAQFANIVMLVLQKLTHIVEASRHSTDDGLRSYQDRNDETLKALIDQGGYDSGEDADTSLKEEEYASILRDLGKGGSDAYFDDDDKDYFSRIDNIDEFALFLQTMHALQTDQPQAFESLGLANNAEYAQACQLFTHEIHRRQADSAA